MFSSVDVMSMSALASTRACSAPVDAVFTSGICIDRYMRGVHTSLRGALMCRNCFSNRLSSRATPLGSSSSSAASGGQQRRETIVASREKAGEGVRRREEAWEKA